jgi:hypothetical protein
LNDQRDVDPLRLETPSGHAENAIRRSILASLTIISAGAAWPVESLTEL